VCRAPAVASQEKKEGEEEGKIEEVDEDAEKKEKKKKTVGALQQKPYSCVAQQGGGVRQHAQSWQCCCSHARKGGLPGSTGVCSTGVCSRGCVGGPCSGSPVPASRSSCKGLSEYLACCICRDLWVLTAGLDCCCTGCIYTSFI